MRQRCPLQSSGPGTRPEPEYLDDDLVGRIGKNDCRRCRPDGRPIDLRLSIAFVLSLSLMSPRAPSYASSVVRRFCRIYLPFAVVILAAAVARELI